jgi:hypothetical protein
MFALSYQPPIAPDPDQRDRYFVGQETGFKQMAEVAEDRNQKRQINIQQQQVNLARQQEARIARDNALARQLDARRIAIAEESAPIALKQAALNLKKTQADIDQVNHGMSIESRGIDLLSNMNELLSGRTAYQQGGQQFSSQGIGRNQATSNLSASREAEPARQLQEAVTPSLSTTQIERKADTTSYQAPLSAMLKLIENQTIGSGGARARERTSRESIQGGQEREDIMLGRKPEIQYATGFGVKNQTITPSYAFEEEGIDWANL